MLSLSLEFIGWQWEAPRFCCTLQSTGMLAVKKWSWQLSESLAQSAFLQAFSGRSSDTDRVTVCLCTACCMHLLTVINCLEPDYFEKGNCRRNHVTHSKWQWTLQLKSKRARTICPLALCFLWPAKSCSIASLFVHYRHRKFDEREVVVFLQQQQQQLFSMLSFTHSPSVCKLLHRVNVSPLSALIYGQCKRHARVHLA